jgi:hypothetical protein
MPHSANVVAVAFQNFRVSRSRDGYMSIEGILGVEKFRKKTVEKKRFWFMSREEADDWKGSMRF